MASPIQTHITCEPVQIQPAIFSLDSAFIVWPPTADIFHIS